MPKFMMLLHDDLPTLAKLSAAEFQRVIGLYKAWSDKMGASGHLAGGEKLKDEGGKHLTAAKGKMVVRDGPYVEAKEIIGGYFLVDAADYAEATRLCEDCPHLALGGRIELREIDLTGS